MLVCNFAQESLAQVAFVGQLAPRIRSAVSNPKGVRHLSQLALADIRVLLNVRPEVKCLDESSPHSGKTLTWEELELMYPLPADSTQKQKYMRFLGLSYFWTCEL